VHNTTAAVLGGTNRTLTRTTGSLLFEGLTARTGHFAAVFDLVGTLTRGRELCDNNLVHQGNVGDHVEDVGGKLDRARLLSALVQYINGGSHG
jgi:hypothetical protein